MKTITSIKELRTSVSAFRLAGETIAFIPTMGNLHPGHIQLVTEAKKHCQRCVVSIFVNPTQFGAGEDFESYPRTLSEDSQKLLDAGVDILFVPNAAEMYPADAQTVVSVSKLSRLHCGAFRPGHFDGVATVVCKLFNMAQADYAFFGQKDFQQLALIRIMALDLNIPIKIISVATVREADGLAMSSRNGYLNPEQRQIAPVLYRVLCTARESIMAGVTEFRELEALSLKQLQIAGFVADYFSICRSADLMPATSCDLDLVILVAARLGKTRLIDNICFSLS